MSPTTLDYSKPPPGYRVGRKGFSLYAQDGEHVRIVTRIASSTAEALAAAWAHYKAHNDPPGVRVIGTGERDQAFDGARRFYLSHAGQAENAPSHRRTPAAVADPLT